MRGALPDDERAALAGLVDASIAVAFAEAGVKPSRREPGAALGRLRIWA
jgi:hypothetical protein